MHKLSLLYVTEKTSRGTTKERKQFIIEVPTRLDRGAIIGSPRQRRWQREATQKLNPTYLADSKNWMRFGWNTLS